MTSSMDRESEVTNPSSNSCEKLRITSLARLRSGKTIVHLKHQAISEESVKMASVLSTCVTCLLFLHLTGGAPPTGRKEVFCADDSDPITVSDGETNQVLSPFIDPPYKCPESDETHDWRNPETSGKIGYPAHSSVFAMMALAGILALVLLSCATYSCFLFTAKPRTSGTYKVEKVTPASPEKNVESKESIVYLVNP